MASDRKEILQRLGSKIRNERNRLGLSLDALAKKVGIGKMTLHRIEKGTTSPSIILLSDISFHLKQPIEQLIREGEPNVVLLKKKDQENLLDPESGIRILAPKGLIHERIAVTHAELSKGTTIETHQNKGFEWAYIIQGAAAVTVGHREYPVEEGDAIFYDAHYPHSIKVFKTVRYVGLFLRDE
jgi:transcriptional regulator with XRE-family HTH domain